MKAKKQHYLWTVFTNHEPVAVVAATVQEDAWKIVKALYDRNDLPGDPANASVHPAPAIRARWFLGRLTEWASAQASLPVWAGASS
ncbi:MAG: hypothetical protein OEL53_10510 [Rhodospirillales bacterium]|nr:hypothetical protein [Rhodospirillales bacterium]